MQEELVKQILSERAPDILEKIRAASATYVVQNSATIKVGEDLTNMESFQKGAMFAIGFMYEEYVERYGVEP